MSDFTEDDNKYSIKIRNRDWKIWFLYFLSFCFNGQKKLELQVHLQLELWH